MGFRLAPDIEDGVSVYGNAERCQEWKIALDELNEVAAAGGETWPEVQISWRDGEASLCGDDGSGHVLDRDRTDPLFVRYRDATRRVSRVCAAGRAGPEEIQRLDERKRQAHNAGADGLRAMMPGTVALDVGTARRLFSLLFLFWDHETTPGIRVHHPR